MLRNRCFYFLAAAAFCVASYVPNTLAGDLKITIPRRSQLTPVQRLNREGVEALRKQQYEKAENLFYKAYLYDPSDPFTLNNLGYVAEVQGKIDRAQSFYAEASQQASNAVIDRSNSARLRGKPMKDAVTGLSDNALQVNRSNVEAIRLLSEGRAPEAEQLLQQTLTLDPHNAFTLNNLGVTKEAEGDLEGALKFYTEAANRHSSAPVVVTLTVSARGTPVSKLAEDTIAKVHQRMQATENPETKSAMLALHGVSAVNRNDWQDASRDFRQAYALDPYSAFSLNNAGYVAEMEGDLETAEFFYGKAAAARGSDFRVGVATRRSAEGRKLFEIVDDSNQKIEDKITQEQALRRREAGPIELRSRDNQPVGEPPPDPTTAPSAPTSPDSASPPASSPAPAPPNQ